MANEFKVKKGLIVDGSNTVLDIQGTQGQLFSVTDSLTGDLFSVSDVSGIPILNVNSSGDVDIDGALGIGATASQFHADADDLVVGAGSGNTGITIHSGTSGYGSIFFADGTANDATEKRGQIRYLQGTERMDFHTDNVATAALSLAANGNATFAGDVGMATGHSSGKFAVMSTGVHGSYDFYNNGTTYLNGAVTIDHNLDMTSDGVIKMAGTEVISATRGISATTGTFAGNVAVQQAGDVYLTLESTDASTAEEVAIKYSNQSTGSNYWWAGLNQSANYSLAYGTSYSGANVKMEISTAGDATFGGTGTFEGGGNTLTLKKGTGTAAIAFAGTATDPEASALLEGIAGGGLRIYTSTSSAGTIADPGWSSKLTIAQNGNATFSGTVTTGGDLTIGGTGGIFIPEYIYHTGDGNTYFGFPSNNDTIVFATNGSTALTLDAANDATFAGNITLNTGTAKKLSILASTHDTNTAQTATLELGYTHSGGAAAGNIVLTEAANNAFDADMTFGLPYNNGSGGSTTRTALTLDGGTLAATFLGNVTAVNVIPTTALRVGAADKWKIRGNNSNNNLAFEYAASESLADTNIKLELTSTAATVKNSLSIQSDDDNRFLVRSNDYTISRIISRGLTGTNLDKGLFSLMTSDGTTNNVEAVRIDSAGNSWFNGGQVGIGVGTPTELLHIKNPSNSWNQYARIRIGTETSDNYASEIGFHRGTSDDTDRGFFIDGGGSGTQHLKVLYTGNVGIGTVSPGAKLEVAGGADSIARVLGTTTAARLDLQTNSFHKFIQTIESDGRFRLYNQTTSKEQLTVTNVGSVGVGDAAPTLISANTYSLSVNSARNDLSGGLITKANGTVKHQQYWDSSGYSFNLSANSGDFKWKVNNNDRMVVDKDGGLDIQGTAGQLFSVTNSLSGDLFSVSDVSGIPIFNINSSGLSNFDGNVLVGKTAVNNALVGVQLMTDGSINPTVSGDTVARFNRLSSDGEVIRIQKDTATVGAIGCYNGVPWIGYQGGAGGGIMFNGASIEPTLLGSSRSSNTNDIGSVNYKWRYGYFGTALNTHDLIATNSTVLSGPGSGTSNVLAVNHGAGSHTGIGIKITSANSGHALDLTGTVGSGYARITTAYNNLPDFTISGTITAGEDVIAYSDIKLKENIKTLDGSKVYDMRGVSFTRKDTEKEGSGVIAQEMQKVAPELVNEVDGTLGVSYGNITGYLIEAIKDLKAEVEQLKKQIK